VNVCSDEKLCSQELGKEPLVSTAARIAQQINYSNKERLLAGMIVGGWDEKLGGQVYTIPLGGMVKRMDFAIGGAKHSCRIRRMGKM
jgi:20S proteasome subunit beta 1